MAAAAATEVPYVCTVTWTAEGDSCITCTEGEIMMIVTKDDTDWWWGYPIAKRVNAKVDIETIGGFVPSACLEELKSANLINRLRESNTPPMVDSQHSALITTLAHRVAVLDDKPPIQGKTLTALEVSVFASLSQAIEAAAVCMDLALLDWRQGATTQHPLLTAAKDFMRGITVVVDLKMSLLPVVAPAKSSGAPDMMMDSAFWLLEDRLASQSPETQVKLLGCSKELATLAQRSRAPPPTPLACLTDTFTLAKAALLVWSDTFCRTAFFHDIFAVFVCSRAHTHALFPGLRSPAVPPAFGMNPSNSSAAEKAAAAAAEKKRGDERKQRESRGRRSTVAAPAKVPAAVAVVKKGHAPSASSSGFSSFLPSFSRILSSPSPSPQIGRPVQMGQPRPQAAIVHHVQAPAKGGPAAGVDTRAIVAQIQAAQKAGDAALAERLMTQLTQATMPKQAPASSVGSDVAGFVGGVVDRIFGAREKENKQIMTISGPTNVKHLSGCRFDNERGYQLDNIPDSWKELFKAAGIKKKDLADPATARAVYAALESEFSHVTPQATVTPTTVAPSKLVSETSSRNSATFEAIPARTRGGVATGPVPCPIVPTGAAAAAANGGHRDTISANDLPPPPPPPPISPTPAKTGAATPAANKFAQPPVQQRVVAQSVVSRPPAQSVAGGAPPPDAPPMDDYSEYAAPPPPEGPVTDFGTVATATKRPGIGGMGDAPAAAATSGPVDLKSQLAGVKLKARAAPSHENALPDLANVDASGIQNMVSTLHAMMATRRFQISNADESAVTNDDDWD